MATELISREVDGIEYGFEQFGTRDAIKTLVRISKMMGKPLVLSIGAFKGKDKPLDLSILANAASILFDTIDEIETLSLVEKLCGGDKVLCAGAKINFDRHYEGRILHLFKVLNTALEVQYGNFFDALSAFVGAQNPAVQHPSTGSIPVSST